MTDEIRNVALTGFGSVGQGFARILAENAYLPIRLTLVADRSGYVVNSDGLALEQLLAAKARTGTVVSLPGAVSGQVKPGAFESAEADVLVEAASTNFDDGEPGWTFVQLALDAGLDVVLASKGPLVRYWDELFERAGRRGCRVGFSATHGAPVPGVGLVAVGLAGSRILRIRALLNSTTGIILESVESGLSLNEALEQAQTAGVVETNPQLDLEGFDSAAKCVILGRAVFGASLTLEDVERQGISELTPEAVQEAAHLESPIRLVSTIEPSEGGVRARVGPERLATTDPLAGLRNGALGLVYEADPLGWLLVAGHGPGGVATAASVIRDILTLGQ